MLRAAVLVAVAALLGGGVAGCAASGHAPHTSAVRTATVTPKVTPTPTPTDPIAGMTLQQKVGQLFMVGTQATEAESATLDAVRTLHVGNVFLAGRAHGGTAATKAVVSQFTALVSPDATAGLPLFVATDQEGGEVQVLQGPGFDTMPTALQQGAMAPDALADAAQRWGGQLQASGVNMNLAPVVDLIASPQAAANNPPIGGFDRQFGYTPEVITSHADAFRAGMDTAGVVPVIKHFPGLGAVTENTDTNSGVTDTTTTATSPSVGVFHTQIEHDARVVMISSAVYSELDPHSPAVFSSAIATGLLRNTLGFTGVTMSDDLSAAQQVQSWSPADRAVLAIEAGVDIVLVSADPTVAAPMVVAVVAKAQSDPAFAAQVDAAARRVVQLKREQFG
ncbi:glycoside hydrolase family 3 protein [Humibacter ginsenosidimutans]|uniref:beta-N-acetylhexosaminidase n=2 Tax=Humibacter ginsenosidimutans TaxID=2599293 RepID=A0A5B8MAT4_9MICO|nr:glycoside hydrolase family 3 protein [Humibacter ginsenosidimutans]